MRRGKRHREMERERESENKICHKQVALKEMLEKSFGLNSFTSHFFVVTLHIVSLHYIVSALYRNATRARELFHSPSHTHTHNTLNSHGCLTPPHFGLSLLYLFRSAIIYKHDILYDNPIITISTFWITSSSKTTPKQNQTMRKTTCKDSYSFSHSFAFALFVSCHIFVRFSEVHSKLVVLIVVWFVVYVYM